MKVANQNFWFGRKVLLTGHTGFKGAWLALLLEKLGAHVTGISLPPDTSPSLYQILKPQLNFTSLYCDIRDQKKLAKLVLEADPEIVIHMAAQALVRKSYLDPVSTIESNVMGTVYLLESLRALKNLSIALVITSDKVYDNPKGMHVLNEGCPLGGFDPYSASKAATEILVASYAKSFFMERGIPVVTARAGNVIGGGDWAEDRLIPDLWRAYSSHAPIKIRYPQAVRPWQHVLDPLYGYLRYIEQLASDPKLSAALNFGPPAEPLRTVIEVAELFSNELEGKRLFSIESQEPKLKESHFLAIDASLAQKTLGWKTLLDVDKAIQWTADWYKAYSDMQDMYSFSHKQIDLYFERCS